MIQARELSINSDTTVSDLYKMIDMPYRITRKAKLMFRADRRFENFESPVTLRVEWEVEKGDPEV